MNIGQNIKNLRELRNLNQKAMAERLEVSQKTYSNIENAGNNITIEVIEKVAKVLEVNFNKILELNAEAIFNNHQTGGLSQMNTATSNNYFNDKQAELYEKLLVEKDSRIKNLEEQLRKKK
jgi:transcriptional regulator with XRE-family HTH domain